MANPFDSPVFEAFASHERRAHPPKVNPNSRAFLLASKGDVVGLKDLLDETDSTLDELVNGFNCLHISAKKNHDIIFQLILTKYPSMLESMTGDGRTSEMLAAAHGNINILRIISICRGKFNFGNEKTDNNGQSALHYACFGGHLDCVKFLLEEDSSLRNLERRNSEGLTPQMMAIVAKHVHIVKYLVTKESKNEMKDFHEEEEKAQVSKTMGYNKFHRCAISGSIDIMHLLVSNEAERHLIYYLTANGSTSLHLSVQHGHLDMTYFLLTKQGLDVNFANASNMTPLHLACVQGSLLLFSLLLKHGANSTRLNSKKQTILHLACQHGHKSLCKYIIYNSKRLGIDMFSLDDDGHSSLDLATNSGYLQLASYLAQISAEQLRVSQILS